MTRTSPLLALAFAVLLVAPSAAAAKDFTIRTDSEGYVTRIGDLRTQGTRMGPRLKHAIREFGQPSSRRSKYGRNGCEVKWRALKVTALFVNFGGYRACDLRYGLLQTMTIKGTDFATTGDIRVGSPTEDIPAAHPDAEFIDSTWWISQAYLPYGGDGGDVPTVRAIPGGGEVTALSLYIGAGGD